MDLDDTTELRNPFPSPPSHYTKYTTHNLNLLALLKERQAENPDASQYELLKDQHDVPDWPLLQLEPPRVDWILEEEDAYFDAFGDRWFVKEKILSLGEQGGNQLYPSDPAIDRRPTLLSILRSLLVSYSSLTGALLLPPPVSPDVTPEWRRHAEWINILSTNLMAAANDLRPVQARENLESMMRRQLELRREETRNIHEKCDALGERLSGLRASVHLKLKETKTPLRPGTHDSMASNDPQRVDFVSHDDVLSWAEQVHNDTLQCV